MPSSHKRRALTAPAGAVRSASNGVLSKQNTGSRCKREETYVSASQKLHFLRTFHCNYTQYYNTERNAMNDGQQPAQGTRESQVMVKPTVIHNRPTLGEHKMYQNLSYLTVKYARFGHNGQCEQYLKGCKT